MSDDASRLRERLVHRLWAAGTIQDPAIRTTMINVPRDAFLPQVSLESAYADEVVPLKIRDETVLSTASQPTMIALMLGQLHVRRGDAVLEIGTGSGYNAALLSELAGLGGQVVTIDLEPDLVEIAAERLRSIGCTNVSAVCADGRHGWPGQAPYDRIVMTASTAAVPAVLFEQLREAGRLVVPIGGAEYQRSSLFERRNGTVGLRETIPCQFIPLR
ncbi:MAG: protein-L-isoaspartate O-methyltransferase [Candidatus Eremiobacteraeota bacterium]|nr:protein-L-isoaspartate O-methyltransferase [Candidatus Eremiobacteraeota bacterium]